MVRLVIVVLVASAGLLGLSSAGMAAEPAEAHHHRHMPEQKGPQHKRDFQEQQRQLRREWLRKKRQWVQNKRRYYRQLEHHHQPQRQHQE